jgi:acetyl esterase/lipase
LRRHEGLRAEGDEEFIAGRGTAVFDHCQIHSLGGRIPVATSGMVGITYANCDPVADLEKLVTHLRENAAALGIDEHRIGVWACSANVPTALGLLTKSTDFAFKCAVLSYGLMFDLDGSTLVAQAAAHIGFANPAAGKSVAALAPDLPLMVVRAGREAMPGLNDTIDRFAAEALRLNLPLTLVNHATAPHAFDLVDETDISREMVKRMLGFLQYHLGA